MINKLLLPLFAITFINAAQAELPLTVEGLLTEPGKLKFELSLAYANATRQSLLVGEPVNVQTGPTSFVKLPASVGESMGNSDTAVATVGLLYGLSATVEVSARISGLSAHYRSSGPDGASSQSESGFSDAWVGLTHQFKKDNKTPAVLGFVELALREKYRQSSTSFKSALLGLTAYKAIDPVVFSLTGAYQFNQDRQDGSQVYKPGNLLLLNPSVAFAVNDRVSLSSGVQWTHRKADRLDGQAQGMLRTATALQLGVSYGLDKGNVVNALVQPNSTGANAAQLSLNWLYTL